MDGMIIQQFGVTYMTSNIDPTLPAGAPKSYTVDVRDNFGHAKTEIEDLQTIVQDLQTRITTLEQTSAATLMVSPANPTNTNSTVYLMMGLAGVLMPNRNGKILVTVDGQIQNSSQSQSTNTVICVGTGTPPVNGAAQATSGGTMIGAPASFEASSNSAPFAPFSLTVLLENVIAQTTYWIDLAVRVTGGVGTVSDINMTAVEIL